MDQLKQKKIEMTIVDGKTGTDSVPESQSNPPCWHKIRNDSNDYLELRKFFANRVITTRIKCGPCHMAFCLTWWNLWIHDEMAPFLNEDRNSDPSIWLKKTRENDQ